MYDVCVCVSICKFSLKLIGIRVSDELAEKRIRGGLSGLELRHNLSTSVRERRDREINELALKGICKYASCIHH